MTHYYYKCPQCGTPGGFSSVLDVLKCKTQTCSVCGLEIPVFKESFKARL